MPTGMRPITTYNVFQSLAYESGAVPVPHGTTVTSDPLDLRSIAQDGFFSVEYTITGDGTCTIAYTVCSTKTGTFFAPTGGGSIASGLTKTPGHGGLAFEPECYPFIKITLTETGNSSNIAVILRLNIQ